MLKIIQKYLLNNKYYIDFEEFDNSYLSHPNYPSLYAITDTLRLLEIKNISVVVPKEQINHLPSLFIAELYENEQSEFVLVTRKENFFSYENEKGIATKTTLENFSELWTGLVLAIEENKQETKRKNNEGIPLYVLSAMFLVIGILISPNSLTILYSILSVLGFLVGYFLVKESLGESAGIVSNICNNANKQIFCGKVLKSKEGKLGLEVHFSDLPIVYFAVNAILLAFNSDFITPITLFSLFSLVIVPYSIYLQGVKIKKWCILCLGVATILILQTLLYFILPKNELFQENLLLYIQYVITLILWLFLWKELRKLMFERKEVQTENQSLNRFKRNSKVFEALLKQKRVSDWQNLAVIRFSDNQKPIQLHLLLSPTCGFCFEAYKIIKKVFEKHTNKISLNIAFGLNLENTENPYTAMVTSLYSLENKDKITALDDWFVKQMDLTNWLSKWEREVSQDLKVCLQQNFRFCVENNLTYTPVLLINGFIYPQEYNLKELTYFIEELEEILN